MSIQPQSFKEGQLRHDRVRLAYEQKEETVKNYFKNQKLSYEDFCLFIRAFKKEMKVEVWIKESDKEQYAHLQTYDFCSTSGKLGPKRKEGDGQIPEGVYYIKHFNPESKFHLSLGINYPNNADKLFCDPQKPGSEIYIHGGCTTTGCITITDDKIQELYILAVEARNNGQVKIPVHIFPCILNGNEIEILTQASDDPTLVSFWEGLRLVYEDFEKTKKINILTHN